MFFVFLFNFSTLFLVSSICKRLHPSNLYYYKVFAREGKTLHYLCMVNEEASGKSLTETEIINSQSTTVNR